MKNLKIIVSLLVFVLILLELFIFNESHKETQEKPSISVSSYSIYDIVTHIAEDSVNIISILPLGVDPHSFEPTPKLMAMIEISEIVFYGGAGLEPWIHGYEFKNRAVNLSKYVKLRELQENEHHEHHHHDDDENNEHLDPHYWLDFDNMKAMTNIITAELIKLQPMNEQSYIKNKNNYINMLDKLDDSYKNKLAECKNQTVILNHNSIGYLADKYGFKVESLSGLSPEAQPTASDIKRIFQEIKEKNVSTIFFENFVNNNVIKGIAHDTNIQLDVFQSLGNITDEESKQHLTYEDIMYKNLEKLSSVLSCQ